MTAVFERINCLHEYISIVLKARGKTIADLTQHIIGRQSRRNWLYDMSNRPMLSYLNRLARLRRMAEWLQEPLSKMLFLAGYNPWAARMGIRDQWAIWEFVERLCHAKERGMTKPPVSICTDLLNRMFGGADIVTPMTMDAMAAYLKGREHERAAAEAAAEEEEVYV